MRWLLWAAIISVSVLTARAELSVTGAPAEPPSAPMPPDGKKIEEPRPAELARSEPKADEPKADEPKADEPKDIRDALGVGGTGRGLRPVEVPKLPDMTVRGYIRRPGLEPAALLEIVGVKRTFVVRKGSEIPVLVAGRPAPIRRDFRVDPALSPSVATKTAAAALLPADPRDQTQVILKVLEVTAEGVKIEAGTLAQTLIVR